jgi:uncharacterized membrane protein HdeD (DUF308 family)
MLSVTENHIFGRGLARRWWLVALRGVTAILFGLMAFLVPGLTLLALVLLCGVFMAADGVFAIGAGVNAMAHHRHGAALLAEGVLGLLIAAILLVMPIVGIATAIFLVAAWAILTGAALLWAAIALPPFAGRGFMLGAALLSLLWGILIAVWPIAGALALAWWLGAYAIASGVLLLTLAARLRRIHTEVSNIA